MGILYFVPARRFADGKVPDVVKPRRLAVAGAVCLEDLGLGHLDGAQLSQRQTSSGPDGGSGMVIGFRVPANENGYYPEEQDWRPVEKGALYVGWAKGAAPGPEVFLRADALPGTSPVVLADGNTWEFIPSAALPTVLTYDASGADAMVPRARDAAHFAASDWLFDYLIQGDTRPYQEVAQHVVTCLQTRYRIGLIEFKALGLLSQDLTGRITCAAVGLDYDEVMGKKKIVEA